MVPLFSCAKAASRRAAGRAVWEWSVKMENQEPEEESRRAFLVRLGRGEWRDRYGASFAWGQRSEV